MNDRARALATGVAALAVTALGLGTWWAMQPLAEVQVESVATEQPNDPDEFDPKASDAAIARPDAGRALAAAVGAQRPLPVWPGDTEERLPAPPGDGPLVVTVVDRAGRSVGDAQVRLVSGISAPIQPQRRRGADLPPAGDPGDAMFLATTDAHGRCRVRATAGQSLVAMTLSGLAGVVAVGDATLARGALDLVVREGQLLEATVLGVDGLGVAGAILQALPLDCCGRAFAGAADAKGRCLWLLDGNCRYDLIARDGDAVSETVRIDGAVAGHVAVRVRMLGVVAIEGRVLDPHGGAVAGASVRAACLRSRSRGRDADRAQTFEFTASSDGDGRVHLGLPTPGQYRVEVRHADWAPASPMIVEVDVGKATAIGPRLNLFGEFQGIVRWKDGPPIANAVVRFAAGGAPIDPRWRTDGETRLEARTAADGSYRLERVPADLTWNVTCTPDPTRPDVRMERAGVVPSPQHFVFEAATMIGASVEIGVAAGAGAPPTAVTVRLRRHNDRSAWVAAVDETLPVNAGVVSVGRLRPGATYTIEVSAPGFGRVRSEPFVAGEAPPPQVVLPRAARLEVRVLDARGDPALDAEVSLSETTPHGVQAHAPVDARGRAAFTELPPGAFSIQARRDRLRHVQAEVELTAGQTARVEVRLRQ